MNPELPRVNPNAEIPQQGVNVEYGVEAGKSYESLSGLIDQQPTPQVGEQANQAASIALPVSGSTPIADDTATTNSIVTDNSTPQLAADDDLIEKEWVDKVKKIIALTKDDPYKKSQVIVQLQADYLKKRYNKILGQSGSE